MFILIQIYLIKNIFRMKKEKRITLTKEQLSIGSQYFVSWDKGRKPVKCHLLDFNENHGFLRVHIELLRPKTEHILDSDEIGRTIAEARNNYVC